MTQPLAFCNYLRGLLDANKASNVLATNQAQTKLVKDKLNSVFKHVIDPSYPSHLQAAMQQAHSGTDSPGIHRSLVPPATKTDQNKSNDRGGLEVLC